MEAYKHKNNMQAEKNNRDQEEKKRNDQAVKITTGN